MLGSTRHRVTLWSRSAVISSVPADAALSRGQAGSLLAAIVLLWGVNWPLMKIGLADMPPLWFSTARMGMGALVLFAVLAATGRLAWPTGRDWPIVISVSLLMMVIYVGAINLAMPHVTAGRSAVLCYTTPLWVAPGAVLFLGERLTGRRLAGLGLGLAGLAVLFNPLAIDWQDHAAVAGNLTLLAGAVAWAASMLHTRGHRWHQTPLQLTPWQMLLAAIILGFAAAALEGGRPTRWTPRLVAILAYNGPVATAFCFWAAATVSRALPAITVSLAFLLVPVAGVGAATLLLGERLDASLIGGFALILGGLALVHLAELRRARGTVS
jgi:drug/metabolite transporter (DMT)-like permease